MTDIFTAPQTKQQAIEWIAALVDNACHWHLDDAFANTEATDFEPHELEALEAGRIAANELLNDANLYMVAFSAGMELSTPEEIDSVIDLFAGPFEAWLTYREIIVPVTADGKFELLIELDYTTLETPLEVVEAINEYMS